MISIKLEFTFTVSLCSLAVWLVAACNSLKLKSENRNQIEIEIVLYIVRSGSRSLELSCNSIVHLFAVTFRILVFRATLAEVIAIALPFHSLRISDAQRNRSSIYYVCRLSRLR